jgi:hypothetical protein
MLHKNSGTDLSQNINYFSVISFNRKKHKPEKKYVEKIHYLADCIFKNNLTVCGFLSLSFFLPKTIHV